MNAQKREGAKAPEPTRSSSKAEKILELERKRRTIAGSRKQPTGRISISRARQRAFIA